MDTENIQPPIEKIFVLKRGSKLTYYPKMSTARGVVTAFGKFDGINFHFTEDCQFWSVGVSGWKLIFFASAGETKPIPWQTVHPGKEEAEERLRKELEDAKRAQEIELLESLKRKYEN